MKRRFSWGLLVLFSFLAGVTLFFIITCTNANSFQSNNNQAETKLQVAIHDTPFKMQGKTVSELNITISRMDIVNIDGTVVTILNEERSMNILDIAKSNPVVLSNVSISPGEYSQLRLVLKDNSTIKVDGEVFDIKIPSGEQSGLKLNGPFNIVSGKLFRLDLDFVADESVLWTKGQGYKLKPVIKISNTAEIIGIFRGGLSLSDQIGNSETILQLNSDNSCKIKVSDYPDYTINCSYEYNSIFKELKFSNIKLDAPGLSSLQLKEVVKKLPNEIKLPVKEWSINSVIVVDIANCENKLYRVDNFDFSEGVTFTELTLTVKYPDSSKNGKYVITEINFVETGMPPITRINQFNGDTIVEEVKVLNSYIMGNSTKIKINSYLFDDFNKLNIDGGFYADKIAAIMSGSYYAETTENPWQSPSIFTLNRDENNNLEISFPKKLNIKMTPTDFSSNNPEISWDNYPGAQNGYLVMVLVKDMQANPNEDDNDGSDVWDIAYQVKTTETKVTVFSNMLIFTPIANSEFVIEPTIKSGDIVRVEVFVLDGTSRFNTTSKKGCLYMDSLNVVK